MTQDNQRVRNAVLDEKLDHVLEGQREIKDNQKEIRADLRLNTDARIASDERWKAHDKEHGSLRTKSWAGDIGAAVTGGIAALIAYASK